MKLEKIEVETIQEFDIDYQDIDSVIKFFKHKKNEFENNGYKSVYIRAISDYYGEVRNEFSLIRMETDQEFFCRKQEIQKKSDKEAREKENRKKSKEEKEKKRYLELKKKYEEENE